MFSKFIHKGSLVVLLASILLMGSCTKKLELYDPIITENPTEFIKFNWSSGKGTSIISISETSDFASPIIQETVNYNYASYSNSLFKNNTTYFWRVQNNGKVATSSFSTRDFLQNIDGVYNVSINHKVFNETGYPQIDTFINATLDLKITKKSVTIKVPEISFERALPFSSEEGNIINYEYKVDNYNVLFSINYISKKLTFFINDKTNSAKQLYLMYYNY